MKILEISKAINEMNRAQLEVLKDRIKIRLEMIYEKERHKWPFKVGQKVRYTNKGHVWEYYISKLNKKSVIIVDNLESPTKSRRIPYGFLEEI